MTNEEVFKKFPIGCKARLNDPPDRTAIFRITKHDHTNSIYCVSGKCLYTNGSWHLGDTYIIKGRRLEPFVDLTEGNVFEDIVRGM